MLFLPRTHAIHAHASSRAEDTPIMVLPLIHLTESERAQAMERFHVLRPVLEGHVALSEIAAQHQLSPRTLQRWIQYYHRHGLAGLSRKWRPDRGTHRGLSPALHQLIEGLALQCPPLTVPIIHRQVGAFAWQSNLKPPSYSAVYHLVRQLPQGSRHSPTRAPKPTNNASISCTGAKPTGRTRSGRLITAC